MLPPCKQHVALRGGSFPWGFDPCWKRQLEFLPHFFVHPNFIIFSFPLFSVSVFGRNTAEAWEVISQIYPKSTPRDQWVELPHPTNTSVDQTSNEFPSFPLDSEWDCTFQEFPRIFHRVGLGHWRQPCDKRVNGPGRIVVTAIEPP
jgi:hypothetical protein